MNEIAIKRHSFDLAKNRLKELSEKPKAKMEIDEVRTHKVTAYELNTRLKTIQENFIAVNDRNNVLFKELRKVYNALDALDKDYIASIVANVKAIQKTSNDVRVQQRTLKQHNEKLANQQSKLDAHQAEIEKNVANISTLKVFKEKIEGYKHLTDIDKIWNDCKTIQNEIRVVSDSITKFSKKATEDILTLRNDIEVDILKMQKHLDEIDSFVAILNGYTHLQDIDNIWDDLDICKTNIERINGNIQTHQNELDTLATTSAEHKEVIATLFKNLADVEEYAVDSRNLITELEAFRAEVSALNHLMEVDKIWKQTEDLQVRINRVEQEVKSHADKLNELEQADGKMRESIDSNTYDISVLKEYKEKLSGISHLDDVDSIWKDVEEHTSKLVECERRDEDLAVTIQKNKEEVNENIADAVQTANAAIESLTKKLKYAYWIAGGSAGLAIIELILLLMKVI